MDLRARSRIRAAGPRADPAGLSADRLPADGAPDPRLGLVAQVAAQRAGRMTSPARVAHCVGFYFPDQVGGTEVYVQDLLSELAGHAVDGYVVAATDDRFREYQWEGVSVARYPANWANIREYDALRPAAGLSKFQELVLEKRPD